MYCNIWLSSDSSDRVIAINHAHGLELVVNRVPLIIVVALDITDTVNNGLHDVEEEKHGYGWEY